MYTELIALVFFAAPKAANPVKQVDPNQRLEIRDQDQKPLCRGYLLLTVFSCKTDVFGCKMTVFEREGLHLTVVDCVRL